MKYRSFLIKYAEIGVKGKNRYLFEDALVKPVSYTHLLVLLVLIFLTVVVPIISMAMKAVKSRKTA